MARFARDCLEKMNELARKLETTLGPDTADLAMRAGVSAAAPSSLNVLIDGLFVITLHYGSGMVSKLYVSYRYIMLLHLYYLCFFCCSTFLASLVVRRILGEDDDSFVSIRSLRMDGINQLIRRKI